MDRIRYMVTFAQVIRAGSFVGAADKLSLAPSVVSKHVSKLERELGVKLLHRTTRSLSLTEAGAAFHAHCARIMEEIEQSEQALARLQAEPQGHLRITTMASICNALLAPMIPSFMARYPKVELDIVVSDHVVNLVEEGYDLALRVTAQPAQNLVARKLSSIHFQICGSPGYFARHGRPQAIGDLARHHCFSYPSIEAGTWVLWHRRERLEVPVRTPVCVNSMETLRQLVLAGAGLALLPAYPITAHLQAGEIEIILPEYRGIGRADLYAVTLPNRYGSPKLKAFLEVFGQHLRQLGLASEGAS